MNIVECFLWDNNHVASVPALRGCHTQAKTVEELLPRVKEAIELCLEAENDEVWKVLALRKYAREEAIKILDIKMEELR